MWLSSRTIQMTRSDEKNAEQNSLAKNGKTKQTPNYRIAVAIAMAIIVMNLARQWSNIIVKMLH